MSGMFAVVACAAGAIWYNYVLIYGGAVLVLVFSIVPTFFITEPRNLEDQDSAGATTSKTSLFEIVRIIRPLWGFLIYAVYAMTLRLSDIRVENQYAEIVCGVLTAFLIVEALITKESGKSVAERGQIGFRKVLAAHSFTWIGVQTMFIYMVPFVQQRMPELADVEMGHVVSISFLVLTAVSAVLPAFVLEPITERIGRVKTHTACIAIMALGYTGILFLGGSPTGLYFMMAVVGIGWAATVSLPFAIMSQKVDKARMGLYMGLFNLSVVLPQLVASLGVGEAVSRAENKGLIFVICAVTLAISAAAWLMVGEGEGDHRNES